MNTDAPEDDLRHDGALRSLARTLVADEARADDVVQDTWLAALRRPRRSDENPRGWLGAVARNAARQVGRADDRRRRRELEAAMPERLPAVEEVAERAALHRELVDRVLALDEPYRSALLLRYFEDLPPRAIARELGVDVATVNQRLWRARQRLREVLDERYGTRNAWRGFFVLALGGPQGFLPPRPPLEWLHAEPVKFAGAALFASAVILGARGLADPPRERSVRGEDERGIEAEALAGAGAPAEREPVVAVAPHESFAPPSPISVGESEARGEAPLDAASRRIERDAPRTDEDAGLAEQLAALGYAATGDALALAPRGRPPGTVRVSGGRIEIGSREKDLVDLIRDNEAMAPFFAAETPQNDVRVDPFDLMVTEVTNEQYEAFVRATGARPPYTWSASAIESARRAWFENDDARRREAERAGRRYVSQDEFNSERWWNEHWQGQPFAVPPELADRPVTYVSFADAQEYARWAGMRLPTEVELQAAVGKTAYPWGERWEDGATVVLGELEPVGSRPRGASREGALDLLGSIWEWTASPYTPYDGYEPLTLKLKSGSEPITPLPPFDANQRVLFGGSFSNDAAAQRKTTRMPSRRDQRTNAVGFRCAASENRGIDLALDALAELREGVSAVAAVADEVEPALTVVLERWTSMPGVGGERLEGYEVITGHDHVAFVPARDVEESGGGSLLGVLVTTVAIAVPELPAGVYVVRRLGDEAALSDAHGDERGRVFVETPTVEGLRTDALAVVPGVEFDMLSIDVCVPTRVRGEGTHTRVNLGLKPGTIDGRWRR